MLLAHQSLRVLCFSVMRFVDRTFIEVPSCFVASHRLLASVPAGLEQHLNDAKAQAPCQHNNLKAHVTPPIRCPSRAYVGAGTASPNGTWRTALQAGTTSSCRRRERRRLLRGEGSSTKLGTSSVRASTRAGFCHLGCVGVGPRLMPVAFGQHAVMRRGSLVLRSLASTGVGD